MTRANPQLPPYPPVTATPAAPQPERKAPPWVWALATIAVLVLVGTVGNACHVESTSASPAATTTAPTFRPFATPRVSDSGYRPATPGRTRELTVPNDLIGRNGAIASAELKQLGFDRVEYASGTPGVQLVLKLSNWTVIDVEPGPGKIVGADTPIVLTMVKKNR
ncbi:hypothetical protein AB0L57_22285 [Nocardia sp. NPDC052254]|uniref:PASTA domain-containing protein n=1 Tax=Nocardia sp. NPDC052254 TaxID=3155681 RepID=UPI0034203868